MLTRKLEQEEIIKLLRDNFENKLLDIQPQ